MHQALTIGVRLLGAAGLLAYVLWVRRYPLRVPPGAVTYVPEPSRYPPLATEPMVVETERFLDTDEDTNSAGCSYYYAGMTFQFTHGDRVGLGRYYDDTPNEFSIYLWPPGKQKQETRYIDLPYRDPFLAEIVAYVRTHEPERHQLKMLCREDYQTIAVEKLAGDATAP